jgi:ACS family tartrate transporter-like MFS transporter
LVINPAELASHEIAAAVRTKLTRRILPFVTVLFILGFLDRVNLSFAAADMSRDLGFGPAVYGLGAGIFFLGYLVFEIPGARLVERRSARLWLGVMLIGWGIAATLMSVVRNVQEFYALRILLGVAEAGFFPGIIIYLSHWFPRADRARAVGALAVGLPAANLFGGPLSGWLLNQSWLEVAGWRWLFFVEGLPSVIAGVATILYLKDRPRDAHWLTAPEKTWLEAKLAGEHTKSTGAAIAARSLFDFRFVLLVTIWFLDNIGVYGFNFWLPMIVKKLSSYSAATVAGLSAAPFAGALIAAAYVSLSSDRSGERRWHTGLPMMIFGAGLGIGVLAGGNLWLSVFALCLAALGLTSGTPGFWALATASPGGLGSTEVAIITSAGALGGFSGPYLMGYLREATGGFESGIAVLSGCVFTAGALVIWGFREARRQS